MSRPVLLMWVVLAGALGCAEGPPTSESGVSRLSQKVTRVVVEVDAQPGAAPGFGEVVPGRAAWSFVRANLLRLFPGREVVVPAGPAEVGALPVLSGAERVWTDEELWALGRETRDTPERADQVVLHVLFVRGTHVDKQLPVGAFLQHTDLVVMFGDQLTFSGRPLQTQELTLVHELGHAVGLVDQAVPALTAHVTEGGHCTHPECVMASGVSGPGAEARLRGAPASLLLFGAECLADLDNAREALAL